MKNIKDFFEENREEAFRLIRELCGIPSPSFSEIARAEYCKAVLESYGAEGVYIDSVNNVVFPINCEGSNSISVFAAHTDTVFPDREPYPFSEDEEKIYCPGVGDDTAGLVEILLMAKYFIEEGVRPRDGVIFLCNSCEEGLGNLVGIKAFMKEYGERVGRFVTLDSLEGKLTFVSVGSHRYRVTVKTEGGHSFQKFGNENAIHELSKIIGEIYRIEVPKKEGSRTTYNVGNIEGGTSVNTIAQNASMLCEYRSDDRESLEYMRGEFDRIFKSAANERVRVEVEQIGDRPCKGLVDPEAEARLVGICDRVYERVSGKKLTYILASTDANIPMSMGIPSVCIGNFEGGGTHTREEYLVKSSFTKQLEFCLSVALEVCE